MSKALKVLGLDPGLRFTGWGIIEAEGSFLRHVAHGVISTNDKETLPQRLFQISKELDEILKAYQPDTAAVEEVFVNVNPASTLKLGAARGVVLLAPVQHGLSVGEYGANKVKKALVGSGHAGKDQMMQMVKYLLPTCGEVTSDSADALAVAICHAHHYSTLSKVKAIS